MAGFSDRFESDVTRLIFNAAAIANIADNAAAAPSTNLWVSLHTADPTDAGDQGTNETTYGGYTRIGVARTTGGWVCSTSVGQANPVANIDFPTNTSTSTGTITHAAVGLTSASTSGKVIAAGTLDVSINFSQNVMPRLTTASTFTID
jgi:hypothetical protein